MDLLRSRDTVASIELPDTAGRQEFINRLGYVVGSFSIRTEHLNAQRGGPGVRVARTTANTNRDIRKMIGYVNGSE